MTERISGRKRLTHWEGEPLSVWSTLWKVPCLEVYQRISSTNDRVRELAAEGAPTLTTVLAEEQTAGRGRTGARWEAPSGSSVLISFLLRPRGAAARGVAPLVLGIAVARSVEEVSGLEAAIKWPNDVLVDGRKVAGILCEAGLGSGADDLVAGVGINVRQEIGDFTRELGTVATSLEAASGRSVSRNRLVGRLVPEVRALFSPGPEGLEGELGLELARRDALKGRRVLLENGLRGRARGIGPRGELVVETSGGERRVVAGRIRALDDADL